ncbi:DNA damage-regulated autophagy modulator protein 1-like [Bufo gargarizans]|uniref:DNA damage-regulated autophagy modulator protein 1-like n=1 Tax=Bufo gargarizans TaxID=30331 RepID=UPI001CF3A621|nr:DNA damage-regulated autophagy modulator protein 1-like [Bufo gargarizans]
MEIRGLAFLLFLWVIWTLSGLCALIALTVIPGHVKYPYISDTGRAFPESVVFTVVFLISAIFGAGNASIMYRFMIIRSEQSERRHIICQRILYVVAWMGCIGTIVTAIVSMRMSPTVHRIGAGPAFVFCAVYNLGQAVCLYKKSFSSRRLCHIRLASTFVPIVALLTFSVCMTIGFFQLCTGRCEEIYTRTGMVAEWTGFLGLIIHQLTNYTDFQRLSLTLSREGVSIGLREKTQDPENPQ